MNTTDFTKLVQTRLGVFADGNPGNITLTALDKALPAKEQPKPDPMPTITFTGETVDERSERVIATLHPRLQDKARQLVQRAASSGIKIKVISGLRTYDEQNALYAQGRTSSGKIVTNARGGYSNHNFGVAFDVGVFSADGSKYLDESPSYKTVGQLGKALGFEWGGDWSSIQDQPHFQLRPTWANGMKESEMLAEMRRRKSAGADVF
jgi:peptidoglycan L-alanyl-D-glutamate endopeptidase CwlK